MQLYYVQKIFGILIHVYQINIQRNLESLAILKQNNE